MNNHCIDTLKWEGRRYAEKDSEENSNIYSTLGHCSSYYFCSPFQPKLGHGVFRSSVFSTSILILSELIKNIRACSTLSMRKIFY